MQIKINQRESFQIRKEKGKVMKTATPYLTGLRIELESAWKNSFRRRDEELMLSLPLFSSPSWYVM